MALPTEFQLEENARFGIRSLVADHGWTDTEIAEMVEQAIEDGKADKA